MISIEETHSRDSLSVEIPEDSDDNAKDRHCADLITRADQRGEENRMSRSAKHIAMNLFPPVFITQVTLLNDRRSSSINFKRLD